MRRASAVTIEKIMRGVWGQLFGSKAQVADLVRRKQFGLP
jgi:hypothetical protein